MDLTGLYRYVRTGMYVQVCIYVCTYMYVCTCMYVHVCEHTYRYAHECMWLCTYRYESVQTQIAYFTWYCITHTHTQHRYISLHTSHYRQTDIYTHIQYIQTHCVCELYYAVSLTKSSNGFTTHFIHK